MCRAEDEEKLSLQEHKYSPLPSNWAISTTVVVAFDSWLKMRGEKYASASSLSSFI